MEGFKIRISALYLSINFFSLTPNFGLGLGCLTGNLLCLCNQRTTIKFILSWNCEEGKVTTWNESVKLCAVFSFELCILSWLHSYTNFCWCTQVLLDGQTITFKNLKAVSAAGGPADSNVREVCVCANGKVFLAPVDSRCQVSSLC